MIIDRNKDENTCFSLITSQHMQHKIKMTQRNLRNTLLNLSRTSVTNKNVDT